MEHASFCLQMEAQKSNKITSSSSLTRSEDGVKTVQGRVTDDTGDATTVSRSVQIDHTQPSLSSPASLRSWMRSQLPACPIPVGQHYRLLAVDKDGRVSPRELLSHAGYNNRSRHF
jgi:hypothetical protein